MATMDELALAVAQARADYEAAGKVQIAARVARDNAERILQVAQRDLTAALDGLPTGKSAITDAIAATKVQVDALRDETAAAKETVDPTPVEDVGAVVVP